MDAYSARVLPPVLQMRSASTCEAAIDEFRSMKDDVTMVTLSPLKSETIGGVSHPATRAENTSMSAVFFIKWFLRN